MIMAPIVFRLELMFCVWSESFLCMFFVFSSLRAVVSTVMVQWRRHLQVQSHLVEQVRHEWSHPGPVGAHRSWRVVRWENDQLRQQRQVQSSVEQVRHEWSHPGPVGAHSSWRVVRWETDQLRWHDLTWHLTEVWESCVLAYSKLKCT